MTERHTRRGILGFAAAAAAGFIAAPAAAMPRPPAHIVPPGSSRALAFYNLHTGESLAVTYWAGGRYLPDAQARINYLLRDFRTDQIHPIDPNLLDLLVALRQCLQCGAPIQVISGYRSPATNRMLRRTTEGVASNSQHLYGRAIDLRFPGRPLAEVHRAALALQGGGVGYYPRSDFVHVDVGPVRRW